LESLFKLGVIVTAIDKLTGPARKMAQAVANLEKTMQAARGMVEFGQRMSLSGALVQGAADKMRDTVFGIMEPLRAVEDASAPLATVITSTMGGVEKSMEAVTAAALEWSKKHREAASQFIETAYIMAGAGLNDVQAIEGTRTALAVATATMGDNAEAANLLAVVYNNMGNKAADVRTEMARLGDVITATQGVFQIANMAQLSEGLKYGVSVAKQFGMSFEQLSTIIGQLNNAGLQGSMAGTAFAATMRQMIKASADLGFKIARTADGGVDFIGTLENIKKKYGDLSKLSPKVQMAFQQAFGDEGLRAVMLLSDQTDVMRKNLDAVTNSMGVTTKAQQTMEATASAQMQILKNNIDALKMDVAKELLPILQGIIPEIKEIVTQFSGWAKEHPELVKTGALLAMIGTGLLMILAPVLTVAGAFITMGGYALQGVTMAGRGIAWLKGKLTDKATLDAIRKIGSGMRTGFDAGGRAAMAAGRWVVSLGKNLGQAAVSAGRFALVAGGKALEAAKAMGIALFNFGKQALFTAIRALPGLIASVWSFTAALLANPITWVVLAIIGLIAVIVLLIRHWDTVKVAVINAWETIKGAVSAGVAFVGNLANNFWLVIKGGIDKALAWLNGLWGTFQQSGRALWEAFTEGLKSVISKPVEVVKSGLAKIREMLPFSDAKTGPLSTLTRSGEAMVTTFQSGVEKKMGGLRKAVAAGLAGLALASPLPSFPSAPPAAVPRVADVITADVPDLSGLFPAAARPATVRTAGPRPVTINGDVHLHVDRVDSPEDLWQALRRFAEEVSG